ncbi:hypothetical protein H4R34_004654 [Dimargaris verticillata]|uniref:Acyl-coenzyme A oxidase n=1 Tax=Dimargaris verticillata TaxID=2761393 RepID=A0A9W8AZR3_9FUNG|nr:hypothetical protein H4R34_004654 [Dimargaris verticillata]
MDMAKDLLECSSMLSLHQEMFMPCIRAQGSPEQHEKFLRPALRYEILGCYAQTELGHGSNVQGLETTATFIPETNEFEIHSPSLTAAKWWSGGLGIVATHAIVMAQLVVKGKSYGPHPFVVPIRSLDNHQPLPGITVGDIGPKFGFNSVDNGYIMFSHYRIPHDHMLERFAKVTPQAEYVRPPNDKLAYGTMIHVRQNIVRLCAVNTAKAATVAIRYCAARRQFAADKHERRKPKDQSQQGSSNAASALEAPVLNYSMVQYRLLPILAQAFALHFTGQIMREQYEDFLDRVTRNDLSTLPELHATSSGLKSLCTDMTVESIEVSRRALGGHGYSSFSGLCHFYGDMLPNVTWEGDNFILTQQSSRYLLKTFRAIKAAKVPTTLAPDTFSIHNISQRYLQEYLLWKSSSSASSPLLQQREQLLDVNLLLTLFGHRAAFLIAALQDAMDNHNQTWDDSLAAMHRISKAHGQYILVKNFVLACQRVQQPSANSAAATGQKQILEPLTQVCQLFALSTIEKELVDFTEAGLIPPSQLSTVRQTVQQLLKTIRPNAVALVDSWAIPDYRLKSALGNANGDIYEQLTRGAEREPANHLPPVLGEYDSVIRPLMTLFRWKDAGDVAAMNQSETTRLPQAPAGTPQPVFIPSKM